MPTNENQSPARYPAAEGVAPLRPSPPPILNAPPDAVTLLKALRRRWVPAVGLGLVLAAVAGPAAWLFVPRAKYTASATILVASNPKRIIWDTKDNRADPRTYQKTQVALLTDRSVLAHALAKPEVSRLPMVREQYRQQADPEEWLKQGLRAEFAGGSEVLELALSGDYPEDLPTVVNAVVDSYKTLVLDEERNERFKRLDELKKLWDRYQRDLKVKRKSLEQLADSVGSHDQNAVALSQQFKVSQLAMAQGELMRTRTDLLKVKAELEALEGVNDAAPQTAAAPVPGEDQLARQVERHPEVAGQRGLVDQLTERYRDVYRRVRSPSDPAVVAMWGRLNAARKNLAEARQRAAAEARQSPGGADPMTEPAGRVRELSRLRAQADVLKGYQGALEQDIERLQSGIKELSRGGLDLKTEEEEINIATDFARKVGAEVEYVQVELNAPERVRVLAPAKTPVPKDELRKVKAGVAASLGSFACVLLGVSLWEFRARRIGAPDEVADGLGLPLVGALPALPARNRLMGGKAALQGRRWQNLLVESIDATRTTLLHASRSESVRVVMVTSAVKGEGKTSLATHLATSLARAGLRTLLVDGDLRRPSLHRLLGQPAAPGFCELVRGEIDPVAVVCPTGTPNLALITAGACDALALQYLASHGGLDELFNRLKADYDFIVIDSAPVLPVTDTVLLAQHADGVIFSVLRDVSRVPEVYSAHQRLRVLGVKILGAVISGVSGPIYKPEYYGPDADE